MRYKVRKADFSDRTEWARLRKLLWPECSDDRHILEMDLILSSNGVVFVAEISQSVLVGFSEISIRNDHVEGATNSPVPYLEGWYVESLYRQKGIGRALIAAAEEFASKRGFCELASDVGIDNKTGIESHKGVGFREVGRSVHLMKFL